MALRSHLARGLTSSPLRPSAVRCAGQASGAMAVFVAVLETLAAAVLEKLCSGRRFEALLEDAQATWGKQPRQQRRPLAPAARRRRSSSAAFLRQCRQRQRGSAAAHLGKQQRQQRRSLGPAALQQTQQQRRVSAAVQARQLPPRGLPGGAEGRRFRPLAFAVGPGA